MLLVAGTWGTHTVEARFWLHSAPPEAPSRALGINVVLTAQGVQGLHQDVSTSIFKDCWGGMERAVTPSSPSCEDATHSRPAAWAACYKYTDSSSLATVAQTGFRSRSLLNKLPRRGLRAPISGQEAALTYAPLNPRRAGDHLSVIKGSFQRPSSSRRAASFSTPALVLHPGRTWVHMHY